ncbi:hypothetical protein E2562_007448 [Oryza meyeriana var. granulata]|uniref:Uncharacterized protein n=1 Tax=Oryza meyeriana var. granulata TaxID=110450 RepID=A0A6G1CYZ2_9ORYZ|nr:hypothetical protein E2562_007448 [Oryza meyeriana var. granulata]
MGSADNPLSQAFVGLADKNSSGRREMEKNLRWRMAGRSWQAPEVSPTGDELLPPLPLIELTALPLQKKVVGPYYFVAASAIAVKLIFVAIKG